MDVFRSEIDIVVFPSSDQLTENTAIALSLVTNLCDGGTSVKAFHMMIMPEKPESKFTYHATHLVGLLS